MEPEIECITGLEHDTETFMKIMRLFNSVSNKQQEIEIGFELIRRIINLIKLSSLSNEIQENLFNRYQLIIHRWQNLKTKVMQAKQRLGPTLKEESNQIQIDLKEFQKDIFHLNYQIENSILFEYQTNYEQAFNQLNQLILKQKSLDKQALDYKQLQTLLDTNIVDFSKLYFCRERLKHLTITWKTIRLEFSFLFQK